MTDPTLNEKLSKHMCLVVLRLEVRTLAPNMVLTHDKRSQNIG